jgi:hypothetical protein
VFSGPVKGAAEVIKGVELQAGWTLVNLPDNARRRTARSCVPMANHRVELIDALALAMLRRAAFTSCSGSPQSWIDSGIRN